MRDVLCVGNAVADTIARPVDRLPKPGTLRRVEAIELHPGGNAVNAAIDLAKLGAKAGVVIGLGNDGFGDYLHQRLRAVGVNTDGVVRTDRHQTAATVVTVTKDGERAFTHVTGAGAAITDRSVPDALLKKYRILHLCGYYLMPNLDGRPALRLLKRAKRLGLTTTFDTSWDEKERWQMLKICLPFVDYFLPSIEEAGRAFGSSNPRTVAEAALKAGVRQAVVLTRAGKGCYALPRNGIPVEVPGYKVKPVDATGAGDAFDAGFITGLIHRFDLVRCCKLGNAAGALSVSALGGTGLIRSFRRTLRFAGLRLPLHYQNERL